MGGLNEYPEALMHFPEKELEPDPLSLLISMAPYLCLISEIRDSGMLGNPRAPRYWPNARKRSVGQKKVTQ